jgi:1-acyl-sn-glycerol-3-phosphate acyltransferase
MNRDAAPALPRRVEWRIRAFTRYFRRWMGRNFHAIRLSQAGLAPQPGGRPVVFILNHPSWWDPLMGMVLAELFGGYRHYVPIDARALRQYRLFEPLGFFGVEQTAEGALHFLKTASAILSQPNNALWVTVQGRFTDPRQRPVLIRPGIGHLIRRMSGALIVPLAIEYPFWHERYPEALAHFGEPIEVGDGKEQTAEQWVAWMRAALTRTMDDLAAEAMTQDAARFTTLVGGRVGVGGLYDWWRWLMARLTGRKFRPGHEEALRIESGPLGPTGTGGGS